MWNLCPCLFQMRSQVGVSFFHCCFIACSYYCTVYVYMYEVCPDNFRKTWITCRRLFEEISWLKSFYSALCLQILLLQLFPPISHLIRRSRPAVYLSLLTPSILSYNYFVKSLSKARKSLRGFRKLFRRSPPRPGLDENEAITIYQRRSIRNGGGGGRTEKF